MPAGQKSHPSSSAIKIKRRRSIFNDDVSFSMVYDSTEAAPPTELVPIRKQFKICRSDKK